LLTLVEKSGEAFLSNAVIRDMFALRACIVNFHTSIEDVDALPGLLSRLGEQADKTLRRVS
jgi:aromatic-L-amino-acid/L-tryptophan decarboxylase